MMLEKRLRRYSQNFLGRCRLIHPNTLPFRFQRETVDESELEVLIDDAGRPRSGTWMMRGTARVGDGGGQLQRVIYELELTFSKDGSEISIRRP